MALPTNVKTRVEVNGGDKHSSLLRRGNNYDRKKLYSTVPGIEKNGSFCSAWAKNGLDIDLQDLAARSKENLRRCWHLIET